MLIAHATHFTLTAHLFQNARTKVHVYSWLFHCETIHCDKFFFQFLKGIPIRAGNANFIHNTRIWSWVMIDKFLRLLTTRFCYDNSSFSEFISIISSISMNNTNVDGYHFSILNVLWQMRLNQPGSVQAFWAKTIIAKSERRNEYKSIRCFNFGKHSNSCLNDVEIIFWREGDLVVIHSVLHYTQ